MTGLSNILSALSSNDGCVADICFGMGCAVHHVCLIYQAVDNPPADALGKLESLSYGTLTQSERVAELGETVHGLFDIAVLKDKRDGRNGRDAVRLSCHTESTLTVRRTRC